MKEQARETEQPVKLEGDPASGLGSPRWTGSPERSERRCHGYSHVREQQALRTDRWIFILGKSMVTLPKK